MEAFKRNYESLINNLGENVNLSAVLEFITYFRCDDVELYKEFLKDYNEVGFYDPGKLVDLYCKSEKITLSDENANSVFFELVNNIWNNNMSYHLTTSISALNIYENGMDPSKKESEVLEDINSLANLLSEDGKRIFFPFAIEDKDKYSFSSIPKLNVNYGRKPEWYLNLTFYQNGSLEEIMPSILKEMGNESLEAKDKMCEVVSKYHELYKNSSRTMVIIPGLNPIFSKEVIDGLEVNNVDKLKEGVQRFLFLRKSRIDACTDKVVSSSELMFIDVSSRKMIDFGNINKTI